jgi:hypothetical protein
VERTLPRARSNRLLEARRTAKPPNGVILNFSLLRQIGSEYNAFLRKRGVEISNVCVRPHGKGAADDSNRFTST